MKNEPTWLRRTALGALVLVAALAGTAIVAPRLLVAAIALIVFVLAFSTGAWLLSHFRQP